MEITLSTFNHSKGAETFFLEQGLAKETCPVEALLDYLAVLPRVPGPFFLQQQGLLVTRNAVSAVLKDAIQCLSMDPSLYSHHSLSIGRAADLAWEGVPDHRIMKTGRWHSDAYLEYLRFDVFHLPPPPEGSVPLV